MALQDSCQAIAQRLHGRDIHIQLCLRTCLGDEVWSGVCEDCLLLAQKELSLTNSREFCGRFQHVLLKLFFAYPVRLVDTILWA